MTTDATISHRHRDSGRDQAIRPTGVLLVGPTGSGKTWIQHRLIDDYGFWSPLHVTTRPVSGDDPTTVHVPFEELLAKVESGGLVGPMLFGGTWHAWRPDDLDRLRRGNERAVVICRPYEAFLINAFEPRLVPVLLSTPATVAAERVRQRSEERDLQSGYRQARRADDVEDSAYLPMFRHVSPSGEDAIRTILHLLGPW
ncbi:MAG: hypothetical protein ACRD2C_23750 [Acidimicrobiales bacterium]